MAAAIIHYRKTLQNFNQLYNVGTKHKYLASCCAVCFKKKKKEREQTTAVGFVFSRKTAVLNLWIFFCAAMSSQISSSLLVQTMKTACSERSHTCIWAETKHRKQHCFLTNTATLQLPGSDTQGNELSLLWLFQLLLNLWVGHVSPIEKLFTIVFLDPAGWNAMEHFHREGFKEV